MPDMSLTRRAAISASLIGLSAFALFETTLSPRAEKIRICWSHYGLTMIAKERGVFEKNLEERGVAVEWVGPYATHGDSLLAVFNDEADLSFGGPAIPVLTAMQAGAPLVFTQFVLQRPRSTSIIAKRSSGVRSIEDLAGRSVAINRSGFARFLLPDMLRQRGVDESRVKIVYLDPPEAGPAFAEGKVDAWWMWSPSVDVARHDNHARDLWLDSQDVPNWVELAAYAATAQFARKRKATLQAVNAALRQEADWIHDNAQQSEAIAQKILGYGDGVRDHFINVRRHWLPIPATDPQALADLQLGADWLVKHDLLAGGLTVSNHVAMV